MVFVTANRAPNNKTHGPLSISIMQESPTWFNGAITWTVTLTNSHRLLDDTPPAIQPESITITATWDKPSGFQRHVSISNTNLDTETPIDGAVVLDSGDFIRSDTGIYPGLVGCRTLTCVILC